MWAKIISEVTRHDSVSKKVTYLVPCVAAAAFKTFMAVFDNLTGHSCRMA